MGTCKLLWKRGYVGHNRICAHGYSSGAMHAHFFGVVALALALVIHGLPLAGIGHLRKYSIAQSRRCVRYGDSQSRAE